MSLIVYNYGLLLVTRQALHILSWKILFKFDPIMLDPDIIISVTVVVCVMLLDVPTSKWTYHFVIKTEFIALFLDKEKSIIYKLTFITTNVIVLNHCFQRSAEYTGALYMKCIMNQKWINIPQLNSIIWQFHGFMNKTKCLLVLYTHNDWFWRFS